MAENNTNALLTLPSNPEAERAILGACMLDRTAANQVREIIRPDDFFVPGHRLIYSCIAALVDENRPCDPVTVGDALKVAGDLDAAGGIPYLAALMDAVPSPSAAAYYARIVADKAVVRTLLASMDEVRQHVIEGGMEASDLVELAERNIFNIATGRRGSDLYALPDLLPHVYQMMSDIKVSSGVTGVPTFSDLDTKYLSGLQKSDLIILAARPGCGKTSMALNIAANAAVNAGSTVAIFSLEMPKEQLVQRMMCTQAKVDHSLVRKGMASRQDFARLNAAMNTLAKADIYIDDVMNMSVSEMRSKCRKLKMEHKLDLVVVDYIQLMQATAGRRVESRQLEVAEISRGLKAMAKELDVPVLALSQLSRQAENGKEPPNLSHLRESGALEQDADVVILMHHPNDGNKKDGEDDEEAWKKDRSGDIVQVNVAKHRNGATGFVDMIFIREYTAFAMPAPPWAGEDEPPPESGGEAY